MLDVYNHMPYTAYAVCLLNGKQLLVWLLLHPLHSDIHECHLQLEFCACARVRPEGWVWHCFGAAAGLTPPPMPLSVQFMPRHSPGDPRDNES
jgi:hypothetical protein